MSFLPCTFWTTRIHGKGDHRQAAVARSDVVRPGPLTPPIGPAYLAASLRHAGHTARIVPLIATGS